MKWTCRLLTLTIPLCRWWWPSTWMWTGELRQIYTQGIKFSFFNSFENMVMADMELGVMMRLNLQWKDSRSKQQHLIIFWPSYDHQTFFISEDQLRLQFNNIREDQFQNDVAPEKQERLWLPIIRLSSSTHFNPLKLWTLIIADFFV